MLTEIGCRSTIDIEDMTNLRKPGASFAPQIAANDDLLDLCQAQG
jgi:hypothetical protein